MAVARVQDAIPVERPRQITIRPGTLTIDDLQGQGVDPNVAGVVLAAERLVGLADRMMGSIETQPPGQQRTLMIIFFVAGLSGLFFGVVGAIGAVWVHDSETRGRLGTWQTNTDKRLTGLETSVESAAVSQREAAEATRGIADVLNGLIDDHEDEAEWMPEALEALRANQPIPRRRSHVEKLRDKVPHQ